MRVAITGGIGEGKSTVLAMIELLGYSVASSDRIARDVLADPTVQAEVAAALGMVELPGRDELRALVAAKPEARRSLNRVTHPKIVQAISDHPATFVEVPLLIEACLYGQFDQVWIVTCGREVQRQRLVERYGSDDQVEQLLSTQIPSEAKVAFGDAVIRTNRPFESVSKEVAGLVAAVGRG